MNRMSAQTYETHVRRPRAFAAVALAIVITFIGAAVNLFESLGDHQRRYSASLILVLSVLLFFTLGICRSYAVKVQDRAIRAEENLRHFSLTGKLLDPRLDPKQVVALRFAPDEEFPELARRAADQNMSTDAIKRAVRNWRADGHRV